MGCDTFKDRHPRREGQLYKLQRNKWSEISKVGAHAPWFRFIFLFSFLNIYTWQPLKIICLLRHMILYDLRGPY